MDQSVTESVFRADALLLGRKAYERLSSFWPTADPEDPRTGKLNSQPKYVASHTLKSAGWNNSTVLAGDIAEEVAKLKEQYDEISIWGSSALITTLLRYELIDEFVLLVYPIVVGGGKRLFNGDTPLGLEFDDDSGARNLSSPGGRRLRVVEPVGDPVSARRWHG